METTVLKITNLTKFYPHQKKPAIQDISFEIKAHEKVGFIGANGSGKTTLFKLIMNLIQPDQGHISILNSTDLENTKQYLGFISEHQEGFDNFTPDELIEIAGKMSNLPKDIVQKRKNELLEWTCLNEYKDNLITGFSKGMFQRMQFALALIHEPQILILDEPMSGLDPQGQQTIRSLLHDLDNYTLLYSSHILTDIEELCNRIIILDKGEIIHDIDLSQQENAIFLLETDKEAIKILNNISEITLRNSQIMDKKVHLEIIAGHPVFQEFIAQCKKEEVKIYQFKSRSIVEELYQKYVKSR
jgi:ABC-2 type transport system ATP-binding protein